MPTRETLIAAALRYASQGRAVLPLHAPHGAGCTCGRPDCASPAKHPRITGGVHNATTDLRQIRTWWQRWPDANIGIATGHGHLVIDLDGPQATTELRRLEAIHGPLPATWTVTTGRGSHYHYTVNETLHIPNSASALAPGIDIRGDGGYALAPPSVHPNGHHYTTNNDTQVAALPAEWTRLLTAPPRPAVPPPALTAQTTQTRAPGGEPHPYATKVLDAEAHRVATAPAGQRNHTLNRAAFAIGTVLDTGHLNPTHVQDTLTQAALTAGLSHKEATATITSGLAAGQQRPRPIPTTRPTPQPTALVELRRYGNTGWQWTVHHPGNPTTWRTGEHGQGLHRLHHGHWKPVNTRHPYQLPPDRNAAWQAITRGFTTRTPQTPRLQTPPPDRASDPHRSLTP